MKITLLNSLLSTLVVGWCVFGVMVHGWQILFYPLAWVGIAGGFFALNVFHDRKHKASQEAGSTATGGESDDETKQVVIKSANNTKAAVGAQ